MPLADAAEAKRRKTITVKEIKATIATMARIPPKQFSADDEQVLAGLENDLKRVVYGQDTAISALSSAIKLARAGLREPEKPIGCYLFSGPTGVGKTEVSEQAGRLARRRAAALRHVGIHGAPHRLAADPGAPPGYVGFDQGGLSAARTASTSIRTACCCLTRSRRRIPDLFNILLQVMDHGKLTDHNGKQIDFRNVILIMTTNAGASDAQRAAISSARPSAKATTSRRSTSSARRNSATA